MADTTNRIAGIAYLSVEGKRYQLAGDLAYSPTLTVKETAIGQDAVHGYIEKPHAPFISGTLRDGNGITVADFDAMTNVNITLELANGKTVIGRNMWTVDAREVKTQEGTFEVKWEGPLVEEA
jgi:hypothetical protein